MNRNYLDTTITVQKSTDYLSLKSIYAASDIYIMDMDEEIDMFSELPMELFSDTFNKQIAVFMRAFKKQYAQYVYGHEMNTVIPKLRYYVDEEGASVIQLASTWNQGNSTLYFAFEEDESDSSFGMVWNDQEKRNFESRSGSIQLNNTDEIIHEVLDFIFRVY